VRLTPQMRAFSSMRADRPDMYIRITDRLKAGPVDRKRRNGDWRQIGLATAKAMTGTNGAPSASLRKRKPEQFGFATASRKEIYSSHFPHEHFRCANEL